MMTHPVRAKGRRPAKIPPPPNRNPVSDAQRTMLGFAHSEISYVRTQLTGQVNGEQLNLLREAMGALELFNASTQ